MRLASLVLLAVVLVGCATAKPVTIPEPVTVYVPVAVPCPAPPPVVVPDLWVPSLPAGVGFAEQLIAMVHDYAALLEWGREQERLLDAYRPPK